MPKNSVVSDDRVNNGATLNAKPYLVKAQLPNDQRTTVSIPAGTTIREALTKALRLRKLEPEMCYVFRLSPESHIKQQIGWDVEVSMLKGDGILVETKDKIPMHTQLSHNFEKFFVTNVFTIRKCRYCQKSLMSGIRCLTCSIEFHRNCAASVPKLCEPSIEHRNYHRRLLADGFSPTNALSSSESPTNSSSLLRPRARSADENSKNKSKSQINHSSNAANGDSSHISDYPPKGQYSHSGCGLNDNNFFNAPNGTSRAMTPSMTAVNFSNHVQARINPQSLEERWEIDGREIERGECIGQGSFATVYKGFWHGPVALKELNVTKPTQAQLKDFINEVAVLKKTRHQNIVLFIGYVLRPQLIIVTQWCKGRSLYKHLHVEQTRTFTNFEIKDIAFGVAQGMEYLHAKNIIHRDLKSNNIFIHDEDNLTVKIGDFGLATFKTRYEGENQIYHPTGSILWMAPEVISTKPGVNPFTPKSDVYSYGIVLYELLSRRLPYFDFMYKDALFFLIGAGNPENSPKLNLDVIPSSIPESLKTLMMKCYERDADKRPQFTSIMRQLEKIRLSRIPKSKSEPLRLNNLENLFQQVSIMN